MKCVKNTMDRLIACLFACLFACLLLRLFPSDTIYIGRSAATKST